MKVVVVEDNKVHRGKINDLLVSIEVKLDLEYTIIFSKDKEEILKLNQNHALVVNIIDIIDELDPSFNGVDLAREIKGVKRTQFIIFLTSHNDYLQSAVNSNVEPLAYINKTDPNMERNLLNAFQKIMYIENHSVKDVRLKFIGEYKDITYIFLDDIYQITTSPDRQKYLVIETYHQSYHVQGKVADYENLYPQLVRCSKSTLVNKSKILKITKGSNPKNRKILFDVSKDRMMTECFLSLRYKTNLL